MQTAFQPANILLPDPKKTDMKKWSVVACDQYTSEPEYWEQVTKIVGDADSTLKLTLPEIYLGSTEEASRTQSIAKNMEAYKTEGIFQEYKNALIYVERTQNDGRLRQGIVGKIDLEQYDYNKGSVSPVRATEATVLERIPPRVKIREGAPMELPHIMILIDDATKTVIEPLAAQKETMQTLYDFDLMQKGGHIAGYLPTQEMIASVEAALEALGEPENFKKKYNTDLVPLVYAMGDGNHSLATAKACYENLKAAHPDQDFSNHPARYALVEIVNLHSEALEFEAIHRVVTEIDPKAFLQELYTVLDLTEGTEGQSFVIVDGTEEKTVQIGKVSSSLTVGSLQNFIDAYLKKNGGKVDYIHGMDVTKRLAQAEDALGFILPDMGKEELFPTVMKDGSLPRKTFSMGHAEDKRFYLECREITE